MSFKSQQVISKWRQILKKNFTQLPKLIEFLELNQEQVSACLERPRFALNLPLRLAEKIEKRTLDDPILKQFLPMVDEVKVEEGFLEDPVQDSFCRQSDKLLKKYSSRVLLITTSACAMHCRYCFRQNFEYETKEKSFQKEVEWIAKDASIQEVILSGGDPLSLSDETLSQLIHDLAKIPHVKILRFHTRFPIGIPERIDASFLSLLESCPLKIFFVLHVNHVKELDQEILFAINQVQKLGIPVLNQAVLLKGVNDSFLALKQLFEALIHNGIIPYYLHQLDRVRGASHFEVEENKAHDLLRQLTEVLPGYAVPKYVREIPGAKSKTEIRS